jgi:superfamily II DNA/RNA helicase
VNKLVVDTLTKRMGLETMTPVQSQTIGELMGGIDM